MGIDSSTSPVTDGLLRSFEAKAKAVNNLTGNRVSGPLSLSSLAFAQSLPGSNQQVETIETALIPDHPTTTGVFQLTDKRVARSLD
nr:hypothetical protein Iba_chr02cCG12470 [Ipomoea batatas]